MSSYASQSCSPTRTPGRQIPKENADATLRPVLPPIVSSGSSKNRSFQSTSSSSSIGSPHSPHTSLPSIRSLDILKCGQSFANTRGIPRMKLTPESSKTRALPQVEYETSPLGSSRRNSAPGREGLAIANRLEESSSRIPSRSRLGPSSPHRPSAEGPRDWITWVPPEAFRALRPGSVPTKDTPSQSGSLSLGTGQTSSTSSSMPSASSSKRKDDGNRNAAPESSKRAKNVDPDSTSPPKALRLKPGGGRKKDFFPANRHLSFAATLSPSSSSLLASRPQLSEPPEPTSSTLSQPHHSSRRAFNSPFTVVPLRSLPEASTSSATSTPAFWGSSASRKGSLAAIRGGAGGSTSLIRGYARSRRDVQNELPAFPFPVPQLPEGQEELSIVSEKRIVPPQNKDVEPHSWEAGGTATVGESSFAGKHLDGVERVNVEDRGGVNDVWQDDPTIRRGESSRNLAVFQAELAGSPNGFVDKSNRCPQRRVNPSTATSQLVPWDSLSPRLPQTSTLSSRLFFGASRPPSSFSPNPVSNLDRSPPLLQPIPRYPPVLSFPSPTFSDPLSPPANPEALTRRGVPSKTAEELAPAFIATTTKAASIAEASRLGIGRELDREERRRIYAESGCPIRGKGLVKPQKGNKA